MQGGGFKAGQVSPLRWVVLLGFFALGRPCRGDTQRGPVAVRTRGPGCCATRAAAGKERKGTWAGGACRRRWTCPNSLFCFTAVKGAGALLLSRGASLPGDPPAGASFGAAPPEPRPPCPLPGWPTDPQVKPGWLSFPQWRRPSRGSYSHPKFPELPGLMVRSRTGRGGVAFLKCSLRRLVAGQGMRGRPGSLQGLPSWKYPSGQTREMLKMLLRAGKAGGLAEVCRCRKGQGTTAGSHPFSGGVGEGISAGEAPPLGKAQAPGLLLSEGPALGPVPFLSEGLLGSP